MLRRFALTGAIAALALAAVPAVSSATFIPGPTGKIAFTSGRPSIGVPEPNDGRRQARGSMSPTTRRGTPIQVTTLPEGESVWHRQPNWSPDHTRIAYAAGSGTTYALWILDLRTGSQTQSSPRPPNWTAPPGRPTARRSPTGPKATSG